MPRKKKAPEPEAAQAPTEKSIQRLLLRIKALEDGVKHLRNTGQLHDDCYHCTTLIETLNSRG